MAPACHLATATMAAVVAFLLLAGGRGAEAEADTIGCRIARFAFGACTGYVAGREGAEVTPRCCKGLGIIKDLATTAEQRRELCECVHLVMIAGGRVIPRRGQLLRTACGFSVDFLPTNFYFNCSRLPDLWPD
ncbi:non-specific lipid-transfer protein 1-like [Aegilops tauschii subsp. strangulata]|uniref:non-specific lipid-transfer protein 1-like n=1 Tax=Aegilops tauschii subsp. strangulata TaxID=200361 RepID=UPI00098A6D50|nr:non-specific lipid-transfer protein 1-like [Aegilops tauschii subsp. strangulata]